MMGKKMLKLGALAAMGGIVLGWGGCLGSGFWGFVVRDAALSAVYEFVWDNDAVFDLFQDDFGTGTQYDDRFADPSREEPDDWAVTELGTGGD
jgi:hypothetical protein